MRPKFKPQCCQKKKKGNGKDINIFLRYLEEKKRREEREACKTGKQFRIFFCFVFRARNSQIHL
jgi:hypothetical protein